MHLGRTMPTVNKQGKRSGQKHGRGNGQIHFCLLPQALVLKVRTQSLQIAPIFIVKINNDIRISAISEMQTLTPVVLSLAIKARNTGTAAHLCIES